MKVRVTISDGDKFAHPPFIEADLSNTSWSDEELNQINSCYCKIMEMRKYKFILEDFNHDKLLSNLRYLCNKLEDELKRVIPIN